MEETVETTNGGYTHADAYPGFKPPQRVELPSGAIFLLRKPQVMKMFQRGQLPNPLTEVINRIFKERDEVELAEEARLKGITVEELRAEKQLEAEARAEETPPIPSIEDEVTADVAFSFRDAVVWASIVAPTVEMAPPVGETPLTVSGALSYDVIDEDDVNFILAWANRQSGVEAAATFPRDTERTDPGRDGRAVLDPAEPVSGHPA